jgi:hypothetical protein
LDRSKSCHYSLSDACSHSMGELAEDEHTMEYLSILSQQRWGLMIVLADIPEIVAEYAKKRIAAQKLDRNSQVLLL